MTESADIDPKLVGADRVVATLILLAQSPHGVTLEEMADKLNSPKSTVHRALATLRRQGLAATTGHGHYLLGDEFLRLAFQHQAARPDHVRVNPMLARLSETFGEASHYAVLEGKWVIYRSKADPPVGGVRLNSTIGGRNPAHLTAVGKVLLAHHYPTREALLEWIDGRELESKTKYSITDPDQLHEALELVRKRGYAVDDQEVEPGICCLAIPAFLNSPQIPSGAVSVSGVAFRTPLKTLVARVDEIRAIVREI